MAVMCDKWYGSEVKILWSGTCSLMSVASSEFTFLVRVILVRDLSSE